MYKDEKTFRLTLARNTTHLTLSRICTFSEVGRPRRRFLHNNTNNSTFCLGSEYSRITGETHMMTESYNYVQMQETTRELSNDYCTSHCLTVQSLSSLLCIRVCILVDTALIYASYIRVLESVYI